MKKDSMNMLQGHPGRLLMSFALPLMAGNVFQQLYTVVDTAIVGKGVGMQALAALGCVDWMNWMYLGIVCGFTQGFSVRMAQKYGQKDLDGLKRTLGVSARLSILIGIVITLVGQLALGGFLKLLHVPQALLKDATLYSRIILLGMPAVLFFNYMAAILRAVGDSQTPLKAMVVASLTNILLDCVAVFWLRWGIAGAALATVFSQCISGMICAWKVFRSPLLRFGRQHMTRDPVISRGLMTLGVSVAAQNMVVALGGMALQSVVNGFDTTFIAGYTATNKLYGVLEIAAVSYGSAVTTYVGQNFGAMRYDRIQKGMRWAVAISLVTSVAIGALMLAFGRPITMLFISSESAELAAAAGETAYRYLFVMTVMLPVLYLLHAYRSALQGMGNATIPFLSGVVELAARIGGAVLIGITGWQEGTFLTEVSSWLGSTILLSAAYYYTATKFTSKR